MISAGKMGGVPKQHPSQPTVDIAPLQATAPPPVNPFTGRPGTNPQTRSMMAQSMLQRPNMMQPPQQY